MRRVLILLTLSCALHLLLLTIRFQPAGSDIVGGVQPVRFANDKKSRFVPQSSGGHVNVPAKFPTDRELRRLSMESKAQALPIAEEGADRSDAPEKEVLAPDLSSSLSPGPSIEPATSLVPPTGSPVVDLSAAQQPGHGSAANIRTKNATDDLPVFTDDARDGVEAGGALTVVRGAIPRYADNPRPVYPDVARRRGWSGEVRLRVRVSERGTVEKLEVEESSGFAVLDRSARRAVRRWRFVPAGSPGGAVSSEVVVPINFRLPGVMPTDARP